MVWMGGWVVAVDCYCLDPRGVVLESRTEWPRTPQCDGQFESWVEGVGRWVGWMDGWLGGRVGVVVDCYCLDPKGVLLESRTEWPRTPECDGQLESWVEGWDGGWGGWMAGWVGGVGGW